MIRGHGDDRQYYNKTICADFSSNVWFGGTDPELMEHLRKNMPLIERYPEPDAADLCRKTSEFHHVESDQVLAFNGSVEAFYTIALAFREKDSAICYPAFSEYEDACRMHDHQLYHFQKDEWEQCMKTNPTLCWIGNPNNPDGYIYGFQQIKDRLESYPDTVLVIDEAYADLVTGFQSAIPLTKTFSNLIVVRSLTKCSAIPGLRLGYVVASHPLAAKLKCFQQPWSVNALAQEAGKFLLDHPKNLLDKVKIRELSSALQQAIAQTGDFRVVPSEAPFFLVELQSGTAAGLKEFLIEEHGILIRDATNFRGLNQKYFRVSTLSADENQLLLAALADWKTKSNRNI